MKKMLIVGLFLFLISVSLFYFCVPIRIVSVYDFNYDNSPILDGVIGFVFLTISIVLFFVSLFIFVYFYIKNKGVCFVQE